jgi:hypothetical protein
MNAADQAEAARCLAASGLRFIKPIRDGAKITGWLPVAPEAAIGRIVAAFGWRVDLDGPAPESIADKVGKLERIGAEIRASVTEPRRLRLVLDARPVAEVTPDVHPRHASEGSAEDHHSVTKESP